MSAITIRGLPDVSHDALRQLAVMRAMSVEGVARNALIALAAGAEVISVPSSPPGMAEQAVPFLMPPVRAASFETMWGALKNKIHIVPGADITAPTGEIWDAEAGRL